MTTPNKIADLVVEKLALGELEPARRIEALSALEREPGGMERLEVISASNAEILAAYPAKKMSAEICRRAEAHKLKDCATGRSPQRRSWLAIPALAMTAAAAALALVLLPWTPADDLSGLAGSPEQDSIIVKGDPILMVYRKIPQLPGEERLERGAALEAGDTLQLKYNRADAVYGAIFSVDGRGAVTLHFPSSTSASTRLQAGGVQALPFSYELDDAPAFERFFFVADPQKPIDVVDALEVAKTLGADAQVSQRLPKYRWTIEFAVKKVSGGTR